MSAAFWAQKAQILKIPADVEDPTPEFPPLPNPAASSPKPPSHDRKKFKVTLDTIRRVRGDDQLKISVARTSMIEEKENRIKELENQILHKDEYIQQLAGDIDEKDFKIKRLEAQLETIDRRIQVEDGITEASRQSEIESLSEATGEISISEGLTGDSWADIVERESTSSHSFASGIAHELKTKNITPLQFAIVRRAPSDSTISALTKCPPPSAPVKPAPKLSFPIINGGKIGFKSSTLIESSEFPWPSSQPSKDIREMSQSEREQLYRGPTITVIIGDTQIRGIPKHMFVVASPKVRKYFEQNPKETYIPFPRDSIAILVMGTIKQWLECMGTCRTVFSLKLKKTTVLDLSFRADCIYLGMDKYVTHFTKQYCDRIRDEGMGFLTFETIANIETYTNDDDSLFLCLANNLASLRRQGKIPEPLRYEEFLAQPDHSRLSLAISKIEARLAANSNRNKQTIPASKIKIPQTSDAYTHNR